MSVRRIYKVKIDRVAPSELKYKTLKKIDKLPKIVDLRTKMPPVYDQGELGGCTGNACAACFEYEDKNAFTPSRLFIYYCERSIEGTVKTDSGASISDGIKVLQKYGVCKESSWPYDISKFKIKPTVECYNEALQNKALNVTHIPQDVTSMKTSLANGFPFVVGISVYSSFESEEVAKTGVVPIPDVDKEECLGGHAVLVCGYDDIHKVWILRNSWGTKWGQKGYFTLPYLYLLDSNLSSDLWNITKVSSVSH